MDQVFFRIFFKAIISALLFFAGCSSPQITEPQRSGIEQLLLSNAVDRALETTEIPQVNGMRVFLSEEYLESYDSRYVVGAIRALLSENGAKLVATREDAEIIVEARSGALGIDSTSSILGIPSVPIVIPAAGSIILPDLAIYSAEKADSVHKLALLGYKTDGSHVFSSESQVGKSHFHQYTFFFFIDLNFTDIPERERY